MAGIKKHCIICGKEFETSRQNQIVCSTACATVYNDTTLKGNVIRQVCKRCGNVFYAIGSSPHCSKECRDIAIQEERRTSGPMDSLSKKLAYCKQVGITYAQYQSIMTLEAIRNGELNDKKKRK